MKIQKRILSLMLLLSLMLSLFLPLTVSAEGSYTVSGLWLIDTEPELPTTTINQSVTFTTNFDDTVFNTMDIYSSSIYMGNDSLGIMAYSGSTWNDDGYRYVNFGDTPQSVSSDYYTWISKAGKKVTITPSGVVDDLSADSSFDINDYPADTEDMSVQLIQIAEGENGNLYVYVYQPADSVRDLQATYTNMSTHHYEDTTQNYQLYSLTLVDSYGTVDKYVVNDFTVSSDLYRYYNIATIYRAFNEEIDSSSAEDDDITGYKGFAVGKCFSAYYYNDVVLYDAKEIDVVDVEIKSVGIVRYSNGLQFTSATTKCDSHYVAFKVNNYDVTDIFDATIQYNIADCVINYGLGDSTPSLSNEITVITEIRDYEKGSNDGTGLFGHKYEWKRIQTISEFNTMLENYEHEKVVFDEDGLGSAQFVFNFLETDFDIISGSTYTTYMSERVTDVAILRLHFATDTRVYNLGAVSDIVSDDGEADFEIGFDDSYQSWIDEMDEYLGDFLTFLMLIILVAIILVALVYLKPLASAIGKGFKEIISLIWSAVTLPFQLIGSLFSGKRR